jgi:hypothetical protein
MLRSSEALSGDAEVTRSMNPKSIVESGVKGRTISHPEKAMAGPWRRWSQKSPPFSVAEVGVNTCQLKIYEK